MLNECLSDKGMAKVYIQFFRLKKLMRMRHINYYFKSKMFISP